MGHSSRRCAAVVVLSLATLSCSSTKESGGSSSLQPVDTVRTNPANGTPATFGVPAAIGGLKITASDPVIGTDSNGPWLTLNVRAENRSQGDVRTPQFELRCSGSSSGGSWLETSTFKQGEPVKAGSSNAGTISLLMPGDERLGAPRKPCATPATVVATLLTFDNTGAGPPVQKRIGWAVPDELVEQMNAVPQST